MGKKRLKMSDLGKPPQIHIYEVNKQVPYKAPEFLKIDRKWYEISYPDGSKSEYFLHDIVIRKHTDASVMLCHGFIDRTHVLFFRSAIRPAVGVRFPKEGSFWELPAGLIEGSESPAETASRETLEEVGFDVPADKFKQLGEHTFPCVGLCGERIFFMEAEVDIEKQKKPDCDGSALEKGGIVKYITVSSAYEMAKASMFKDSKTELGVRRFADKYLK